MNLSAFTKKALPTFGTFGFGTSQLTLLQSIHPVSSPSVLPPPKFPNSLTARRFECRPHISIDPCHQLTRRHRQRRQNSTPLERPTQELARCATSDTIPHQPRPKPTATQRSERPDCQCTRRAQFQ